MFVLGSQLRCKTSTVCSICQISPIFFLSFLPDFTVRIPGWIVWAVGPKWRGFFFQQNVAYPNRWSYTKWRSYTIWGPYEIFMCARLGACRALSRAPPGSLSVAKNTPRLIAVGFSSFTTFFTGQALMLCQNEKMQRKWELAQSGTVAMHVLCAMRDLLWVVGCPISVPNANVFRTLCPISVPTGFNNRLVADLCTASLNCSN